MNTMTRFALALLLCSMALTALAADPEPQAPTTPPPATKVPQDQPLGLDASGIPATPTITSSPMMIEIQQILMTSKAAVAELVANTPGINDRNADMQVQQEISNLKQQAELDILAVQARYARAAGDEELAVKIEMAIASILSPPTPTAPAEPRPAPENQN